MPRGEISLPGETRAKTACGHDSCGCAKARCCLECPLERCLTEVGQADQQEREDRQRAAVEMQTRGMSLRAIGRELGMSRSGVKYLLEASRITNL